MTAAAAVALVPAHMDVFDAFAIGSSFAALADALRTDPEEVPPDDPLIELQRDADLWHGRG